jgi:hypothetical protein
MRWLLILCFFVFNLYAQDLKREANTNYKVQADWIERGRLQYGTEWLTPTRFSTHPLIVMDYLSQSKEFPGRNQVVLSSISFVTATSFDRLSKEALNKADIVKKMFDANSVTPTGGSFLLNTTVKAYGFPIGVDFVLTLKKVEETQLSKTSHSFIKSKLSHLSATGRNRILIIEMNQFSQLIYKNTGIVYMQELTNGHVALHAIGVSTINIQKANLFFPFGMAQSQMINNIEEQIIHMAREIQKL